jgi:hypothetical protein
MVAVKKRLVHMFHWLAMIPISFLVFLFLGLLPNLNCFSQSTSDWTTLDHFNHDTEFHFSTEKKLSGLCFITLSDSFDYYQNPIILKDRDDKQIMSIVVNDTSGVLTNFKGSLFKSYDTINPFNPWFWSDNPDYFRLALECTDSLGNFYKVKLNETEFAWIKKTDKNFKKEGIKDFILRWTSATTGLDFDRISNPLRKEPNTNIAIIEGDEQNVYKIWTAQSLEMYGDWLKIKTTKNEVGWIKWRDGINVLIRINYFC